MGTQCNGGLATPQLSQHDEDQEGLTGRADSRGGGERERLQDVGLGQRE